MAVFGRQALEPVEIGGWTIPREGVVRPISYVMHHDPRWFPDPQRLEPDRFTPEREEKLPQFAWFPFGRGPRVCIGNNLAMMEMTLLTALLVQRFTLTPAPGQQESEPQSQLSLRPRGGLRLTLTPRAK